MKSVPFDFVLEAIHNLTPYTKPMFGCTAVYVDLKIIFILRDRESFLEDNGIWVATTAEYVDSLKKDFPSLRSLKMFGPKSTVWQVLPSSATDFEESANKLCDLVLSKDPRIGKIPNSKAAKKKRKTSPSS